MNIWVKSLLTGALVSVLAVLIFSYVSSKSNSEGNGIKAIFSGKVTKRLYKGHYQLKIVPEATVDKYAEQEAIEIIETRLEKADYDYEIKRSAPQIFDIAINNIDDTNFVAGLITTNSQIEFREIYTLNEIIGFLSTIDKIAEKYLPASKIKKHPVVDSLKDSVIHEGPLKTLDPSEVFPEDDELYGIHSLITFFVPIESTNNELYPQIGAVKIKDTSLVNQILRDSESKTLLPSDAKFFYGPTDYVVSGNKDKHLYLYCLRIRTNPFFLLNNDDIKSVQMDFSENGQPQLSLLFTTTGTKKWANMTQLNVNKNIGIIVNNFVVSAPKVNEPIVGGSSLISGGFTVHEVRLLALQLSGEKIPANIIITKSKIESPKVLLNLRILLLAFIAFVIATTASWFIFNALKKN